MNHMVPTRLTTHCRLLTTARAASPVPPRALPPVDDLHDHLPDSLAQGGIQPDHPLLDQQPLQLASNRGSVALALECQHAVHLGLEPPHTRHVLAGVESAGGGREAAGRVEAQHEPAAEGGQEQQRVGVVQEAGSQHGPQHVAWQVHALRLQLTGLDG